MTRLLSVDWDYFFPDVVPYDWGHRESRLFAETLWNFRTMSRNLLTGEEAIETVRPSGHEEFWEGVVKGAPVALAITESHADLFGLLESFPVDEIVGFDQHHDLYYGKLPDVPECGSWAGHALESGLVKKYTLVYPAWRKDRPENPPDKWEERFVVRYDPPEQRHYDMVFICRSSSWTPSWSDDEWLGFVNWWKQYPYIWNERLTIDFVQQARSPNLEEAQALRVERKKMLDNIEALNKASQ